MLLQRTAVWAWAVAELTGCRAVAHDVVTNHIDAGISLVDPFRYLRGQCYESEAALPQHNLSELQNEKDCGDSLSEGGNDVQVEVVSGYDQPGHASVVVQRYTPLEGDTADILSFEAWKERQFQEAVSASIPSDAIDDTVSEHSHGEQRDEDNAASHQPSSGKIDTEQKREAEKDFTQEKKVEDVKAKSGGSPGKSSTNPPHRYNYASPDCSARVISSSSASQHASSVLHKSKDRYMLTPCNAKEHWVVIELCDEIRIEAIEIGMFEFFSGVVKDVVLSVDVLDDEDEDDPSIDTEETQRSKGEWEEVGTFTAKNVRGNQVFSLPNPTSFHRFIRLDFPSYYGKEYYCPISSVKAYGMNQMEAFKWESRRNKQREDEWARKQAEEERKRKLTLAQVVDPVVASESQTSVADVVPSEDSRDRVVEDDQARISSGAQGDTAAEIKVPHVQSTTIETPTSTLITSGAIETNQSAGVLSAGPAEISPATPQEQTVTMHAQASTSSSYNNVTAGSSDIVNKSDSSEAEKLVANATSSSAPVSTAKVDPRTEEAIYSSRITSKGAPVSTMSTPPRQSNVKADSSESIYAFIIRRLNALEGNATLGMMYVEEQSRVNRGLLNRLEKSWSDWKLEQAHNQRLAAERERIATADALEEMRNMIDQRDAIILETAATLKAQFDSMTEEIAWEKRRGIAQLLLLMIVIGLSALSRSATVDVQAVRPLMQARNSIAQETKRGKEEKHASREILENDQGKHPLVRTRSLGHGSRGSPRRPATPVQSNKKARPNLTLNAKSFPDRLDAPRTAVPARSRHFLIPNGNTHTTGRRLARSSHLHTIDADRVRRKLQLDSAGLASTPTRSSQISPSPLVSTPTPNGTQQDFIEDAILDNGYSEHSEYELASASEAEADLDN